MPAKEQSIQLPTALFKGLVLNPSIVNRDFNSAQLCNNFLKLKNGQGTQRPPTVCTYMQNATYTYQILFPFTYSYHDTTTGSTQEELLGLGMAMNGAFAKQDTVLYRLTEETFTIGYSGAGSCVITLVPVVSAGVLKWQLTVTEDGSTTIFSTLASASAFSPTSLQAFITSIDARATITCTPGTLATTAQSTPVDIVPKTITIASGGTATIDYYDLETIGTGVAAPKVFTDADFILPSALNFSNVIYFAYGDYEMKYDGQDFYRSGLPQATISSTGDSVGTTFNLNEVYIYKLVYARTDAKGNIIEGEDSDDTLAVATHTVGLATSDIALTVDNLTASSNTNFAIKGAQANGLQAGVTTLTVDAGHTIVVGDTIYLYDTATSAYVTRVVTGIAATTITFAGAVSVADNSLISNNIRIQIWRTKNGGTDFYFVDEIVNDYDTSVTIYTDNTPDTDLIEPYLEQLRKHSLPPKCSYIGEHQGLKVTAGDPDYPNRLSWALPDASEAYPLESNNFDVKGAGIGALTGFGTVDDDDIVVFKEFGHGHVKGTLDDLSISFKDASNTGIGCTSFRSLAYIGDNDALVGLSRKGVFIFSNDTPSLAIGNQVNPLLDKVQTKQVNGTVVVDTNVITGVISFDVELVLKRATAINDKLNGIYHLYVPAEAGTPAALKAPIFTSAKYLTFDYDAEIPYWSEYSFYTRYHDLVAGGDRNISPNAGFAIYNNNLWIGSAVYGNVARIEAMLFKYNEEAESDEYVEAAYPVYLDIHYTPFTRAIGSAASFFKALYVNFIKYLNDALADPGNTTGLGSDFNFSIKTIKDYKNYATPDYITNSLRTFRVASGQTVVPIKCVTDKCRAFQIQLTNGDNELNDTEQLKFDSIELVYNTPYDPKQKDSKGVNG